MIMKPHKCIACFALVLFASAWLFQLNLVVCISEKGHAEIENLGSDCCVDTGGSEPTAVCTGEEVSHNECGTCVDYLVKSDAIGSRQFKKHTQHDLRASLDVFHAALGTLHGNHDIRIHSGNALLNPNELRLKSLGSVIVRC